MRVGSIEICDRAEEIVDEAIANGEKFSELLCKRAVQQAKYELTGGEENE